MLVNILLRIADNSFLSFLFQHPVSHVHFHFISPECSTLRLSTLTLIFQLFRPECQFVSFILSIYIIVSGLLQFVFPYPQQIREALVIPFNSGSFIKRIGPRTEPWGTPVLAFKNWDFFFHITHCLLFVCQSFVQGHVLIQNYENLLDITFFFEWKALWNSI